MIPTFDIKVIPRSDSVQVSLTMGAEMRGGRTGDAVPVGFPATKPPVSLDSSGQEGLSPSFGIHPKSKNRMCEMITHILLCFSEKQQKSLFLFCHFSLLAPIIIVVFTAIAVKAQ